MFVTIAFLYPQACRDEVFIDAIRNLGEVRRKRRGRVPLQASRDETTGALNERAIRNPEDSYLRARYGIDCILREVDLPGFCRRPGLLFPGMQIARDSASENRHPYNFYPQKTASRGIFPSAGGYASRVYSFISAASAYCMIQE